MGVLGLLLALHMVDFVYCGQYDNFMVQEHNKFRRMEAKKGAANIEKMVNSDITHKIGEMVLLSFRQPPPRDKRTKM